MASIPFYPISREGDSDGNERLLDLLLILSMKYCSEESFPEMSMLMMYLCEPFSPYCLLLQMNMRREKLLAYILNLFIIDYTDRQGMSDDRYFWETYVWREIRRCDIMHIVRELPLIA